MTVDNKPLYKKYNIDIESYRGMPIDYDVLRIRTVNCLKHADVYNIDQLLSLTYEELLEIKNLGRLSLNDIEEYVKSLELKSDEDRKTDKLVSKRIEERRDLIFDGVFDSELYEGLSEKETEIVNACKIGHELLEKDLISSCRSNPVYVYAIRKMFNDFSNNREKIKDFEKMYNLIESKVNNHLKSYCDIYPMREEMSEEFRAFCMDSDALVKGLFDQSLSGNLDVKEKTKFVNWMAYDLQIEFEDFLEGVFSRKSSNTERVIELRAKKMTLQQIGDELGITRERVRQIEKKIVDPFCRWQRIKKFLPRLSADFDGETILEATDFQDIFGNRTEVLLYLLQCADDEFFSYDRDTDTVIIVDDDITDFARDFVEKMPDELELSDVDGYRNAALNEHDIPVDIFDREVSSQYNLSGSHYHRNKLSLEKMYQIVLKRYYPSGMNIHDDAELDRFRSLLVNEFGEVSLPQKNRSISAAIGRCCILCGRGKYRVKDNEKIPHELMSRIHDYIMTSERSLFFMNEIFLEFENELKEAGIDNRFFLQGVLREEYDNELFFRRDYVSKDSGNLSMYRDLQLYVKKSEYPVTKEQIRAAYPGITEIMISISLADDDIINYFGSYIHSSKLNLYEYDRRYFDGIVTQILNDSMPHHCDEIFDTIQNDNPELLNRLGIYYQYSLFSLLQYLYKERYEFTRPYIAEKGVNINKPIEMLQEYVSANDVFEITEFLGLAKEYHYTVYDILKFLNSWNGSHFLINKQEMASLEYIGITEDIACEVEKCILNEIGDSALIASLECLYKLPQMRIPWNEWLVYSVIERWGSELEANTTSNQFRLSSPVVSRVGKFNRDNYEDLGSEEMVQTVDLNDIDAVEDYIMDDFDMEW